MDIECFERTQHSTVGRACLPALHFLSLYTDRTLSSKPRLEKQLQYYNATSIQQCSVECISISIIFYIDESNWLTCWVQWTWWWTLLTSWSLLNVVFQLTRCPVYGPVCSTVRTVSSVVTDSSSSGVSGAAAGTWLGLLLCSEWRRYGVSYILFTGKFTLILSNILFN